MGGTVSPPAGSDIFHREDWTPISQRQHAVQIKPRKTPQKLYQKLPFSGIRRSNSKSLSEPPIISNQILLLNKLTGQEVLEYSIQCDQEEYLENMNFYNFRRENSDCIFAPKYIQIKCTDQFCCVSYQQKIYIENFSIRLSQVNQIPFKDSLYVLQNCLNGYEKIFEKIQNFEIKESFIGITHQGIVKVWIHPDLSKNYPLNLHLSTCQSALVLKIIQIIENKIIPDSVNPLRGSKLANKNLKYPLFSQYLRQNDNKSITFQETRNLLNRYAATNCIQIPKYFTYIMKRIRAEQGIEGELSDEGDQKIAYIEIMKQSNVLPLKAGILKFKLSGLYSSYARSDSNATYADLLNSQASKKKLDKIKKSGIINFPAIAESQEPIVQGNKRIQRLKSIDKSRDVSSQSYFSNYIKTDNSRIHAQNSRFKESSCREIQEVQQDIARSKHSDISQSVQKISRKEKTGRSFNNFKKIFFTYGNIDQKNDKTSKPVSCKSEKIQTNQADISQSPNVVEQRIIPEQKSTFGGEDFELDPEILADLQKYAII